MTNSEVFFIDKVTFTNFIKINNKDSIPRADAYGGTVKTAYPKSLIHNENLNIRGDRKTVPV